MNAPRRRRALWILPPILIGVAVLALSVSRKPAPTAAAEGEPVRAVRTLTVEALTLVPHVQGYGSVQPAQVWSAVAQVAGRVVQMHPQLRDGEILPAGTELLRIDPVDYELNLAQAQATLAELDVQQSNTEASLEIERRNLALAQRERERIASLAKQGTASRSDTDSAERNLLASRAAVQNLENALALLPSQRNVQKARVAQAERDLQNTLIRAPFDLRVAGLAVEAEQYVGKGQTLFRGDAVERVEIVAQFNLSEMRKLFIGQDRISLDPAALADRLPEMTGLKARVNLDMGGHIATWDARFVRFSDQIDSKTRTLGVVVAVDRPFAKVRPGERPPLSKGMLVQVDLEGRAQAQRILVPRHAIHAGQVYLVDDDSRLALRDIELLYNLDGTSVVASGLSGGEQLVLSDLVPAVAGMRLDPRPDDAASSALRAAAGSAQ
ncbi:MAG: efflux RND transporter periplasmic adaptor subunit [Gammaproteobacteria bacterium]|nr:efflux RND transporter periplasmic adaptor subunit [Gammaproteobacteria bacterium]